MSQTLLEFAKTFAQKNLSAELFVGEFIDRWRAERDSGEAALDPPELSERLSSMFCIADLFNPDEGREEYEYDESRLRDEIMKLIREWD